ncbi:hypothetical protein LJC49_00650 [Ruminococcaceae bacterium OttesenSCG-928-I18]|nr:hypothetical protein [Ruminococcaceae bacterium OttesenSCG-928-I18]
MAYIRAEIKMEEMTRTMPVSLYFPTDLPEEVGNKVKGVITLFHGMGNSPSDWMMMSAATRYAADNGYILVAPGADNSFFADMAFGSPYYTAITEYLPRKLDAIFKIPRKREINYLAGLSMGGYGAMHVGLSNPDKYAAIGSFSGSLDAAWILENYREDATLRPIMEAVVGTEFVLPERYDVFRLAEKVSKMPKKEQPRIFCTCGRQDGSTRMYLQNLAFKEHAAKLPLDYTFREWDGVHEWNFWDRSLAEFIGFIQGSDYGRRKRGDWSAPESP